MDLQPLKTFRRSSNQASLLRHDGQTFLVKRYTGPHAAARRDCEAHSLAAWNAAGFAVPAVFPVPIPDLEPHPYLVVTYLEGITLQEHLQSSTVERAQKFALLRRILEANCRRHTLAAAQRDPRLLHPDPNTSNVLCVQDNFYFIDFETVPPSGNLIEAAAIEIAKFCRWTVRDLGRDALADVLHLLAAQYRGHPEFLWPIVHRTRGRPFQFFHRWRDRRRKRAQAGEVTKYDLADALAAILKSPPSQP